MDTLNTIDIGKLQRFQVLKEELKELEEHLKPKIEATIKKYGVGNVTIGANVVKLSTVARNNVSWKGLAESLIDAKVIENEKPNFTTPSISYNAKIIGKAKQASEGEGLGRKIA